MKAYLDSSLLDTALVLAVMSLWLWKARHRLTPLSDWIASRAQITRERAREAHVKNDDAAFQVALRQHNLALEQELHLASLRAQLSLSEGELAALATREAKDEAARRRQERALGLYKIHLRDCSSYGGAKMILRDFISALDKV